MPLGEPFTPAEFLDLGARKSVAMILARLAKTDLLKRVTRGFFVRPRISQVVGRISPTPLKVAELISTGEIIQVQGAEAARRLELTTQVPMAPIFVTPGPSRMFHMGKLAVELRHISQRKLLLAGRPAGIALTVMWYLGKREVTPRIVGKIRRKLSEEEFEALKSVMASMPPWMRDAMLENERSAFDVAFGSRFQPVERSGLFDRLIGGYLSIDNALA